MDKLELKHLVGYLPYGLKVQYEGILNGKGLKEYDKTEPKDSDPYSDEYILWWKNRKEEIGQKIAKIKEIRFYNGYSRIYVGIHHGFLKPMFISDIKPILRPLSSITIDWFHNNIDKDIESFLINCEPEHDHLSIEVVDKVLGTSAFSYDEYRLLFRDHFDIHGLINKGLAIDINTL